MTYVEIRCKTCGKLFGWEEPGGCFVCGMCQECLDKEIKNEYNF
jgi:hypothetical protein